MQTVATHIEMRQNRSGQNRAYLEGTRIRVQDVAVMAEYQGQTPDQIVEALPHLTLGQVHAALSYCFDHREEIQRELRDDQEFVTKFRQSTRPSLLEGD